MPALETIVVVSLAFLVAGSVKGVVGLGLPTVALAILALTLGIREGVALVVVPSLITNLYQGLSGGSFGPIVKRFWPLLAASCVGVWLGTGLLAEGDALVFSGLLGVFLSLYAVYSLAAPSIRPPERAEVWLSPLMGFLAGGAMGMTGSFVVPGVLYLQALGLRRDVLVQAMGVAFSTGTLALAAGLGGRGLLSVDLGLLSAYAVIPAAIGMQGGAMIRKRLPEERFRRVFLLALLAIGLYLAGKALL